MDEKNDSFDDSPPPIDDDVLKRTVKDSVFTDLFRNKEYVLQLYRALHREDSTTTEDDLTIITLKAVIARGMINDLGFRVGNRLIVLVEAQSTWSSNIVVRLLMYYLQTLKNRYGDGTREVFASEKVSLEKPEFYVIYTGASEIGRNDDSDRRNKSGETNESDDSDEPKLLDSITELSLNREFFNGEPTSLDVRVKVIRNGAPGDIISQYVNFTRICDEQVKEHRRSLKAINEIMRICAERGILVEYLNRRRAEIMDILTSNFTVAESIAIAKIDSDKKLAEKDRIIAEERRQKEEERLQKEEAYRQKEEERRQKEEERRQKEEAVRQLEEERRRADALQKEVESLRRKGKN